jgi:hypothetical protein
MSDTDFRAEWTQLVNTFAACRSGVVQEFVERVLTALEGLALARGQEPPSGPWRLVGRTNDGLYVIGCADGIRSQVYAHAEVEAIAVCDALNQVRGVGVATGEEPPNDER